MMNSVIWGILLATQCLALKGCEGRDNSPYYGNYPYQARQRFGNPYQAQQRFGNAEVQQRFGNNGNTASRLHRVQNEQPAPNPTPVPTRQSNTAELRQVSRGLIKAAIVLDNLLGKGNAAGGNVFFAPVNIIKILATVMLGTGGSTQLELERIITFATGGRIRNNANFSSENAHMALGTLIKKLTANFPGATFGKNINIAGGVFIQNDFPVKQKYVELAKRIYNTKVYHMDFQREGSRAARFINQWVSNETYGKINDIVQDPVDSATKVVFTGAIYFNGDWEFPFPVEYTRLQPFYLNKDGKRSGNAVMVPTMINQASIPYYNNKGRGYQAIGIPYRAGEIFMFVIVPNENVSVKNITDTLSAPEIEAIIHESKVIDVFYSLPKMQIDSRYNLSPVLKMVRVKSLFNPGAANFTGMTDAGGIYASDIVHKAQIRVDEVGTTAAAATAVTISRSSVVSVRADRPFFFFIFHKTAGVLTFWGNVNNPSSL